MTTEDKIKEAFEAQYGTRNEWIDMQFYDSSLEDFRAGYIACLNSLEYAATLQDNGKEKVAYFLPEGVAK